MSVNHIHISHLVIDVSTHCTYDACLVKHLALNGYFTTSEPCAINLCQITKGIFFISDICHHQGTHIQIISGGY